MFLDGILPWYPLEWQYRRAMEISDENIIDLYIILGVFCGTLLISTLVCIAIYCHWHQNHKYSKFQVSVVPIRERSGVRTPEYEPRSKSDFKDFNPSIFGDVLCHEKSGYNKIDQSINVKSKRMKLPSDLYVRWIPADFLRWPIVSTRKRPFKFLTDSPGRDHGH